MRKRIKDIEAESECCFAEAIADYVDSCLRTGHIDLEECTRFFMSENNLDRSEYYQVLTAIKNEFQKESL